MCVLNKPLRFNINIRWPQRKSNSWYISYFFPYFETFSGLGNLCLGTGKLRQIWKILLYVFSETCVTPSWLFWCDRFITLRMFFWFWSFFCKFFCVQLFRLRYDAEGNYLTYIVDIFSCRYSFLLFYSGKREQFFI